MRRGVVMPLSMGVLMGFMALWMLHGFLTGSGGTTGGLFLLGHIAVIAGATVALAFGLHRRWPAIGRVLSHRPSSRHFAYMTAAALVTATLFHLIHGGPVWT